MATDHTCIQCGKPYDASVVANRFAGVCPACLAKFAADDSGEVEQSPGIADPSFKPPLKLGGTFHGLEIVELLGAGGMGVVYKARQTGLDRLVALKVLSPQLSGDREFISRFNREAKAMAALSHAGIVQVFDFGQEAGLCFLVMEYIDGLSLRQLMRDRKLAPEEALKVVPKICEALEYAHSKGVIHRDIKPENILLDRDGRVKIADFGLAKVMARDGATHMTRSHVVMGTPGYMAPEQYQSMSVDHRADIYSLGAVFYEMLTRQLPVGRFEAPSKRVQIDVRLDEIVMKALENEPDRRYQKASEFKTRVETVWDGPVGLPAAAAGSAQKKKTPETVYLSVIFVGVSYLCLMDATGVLGRGGRGDSVSTFFLFQFGAALCAVLSLIQFHQHPERFEGRPYALMAIFFLFPPIGIIAGIIAVRVVSRFDAARIPAPPPPPAEPPRRPEPLRPVPVPAAPAVIRPMEVLPAPVSNLARAALVFAIVGILLLGAAVILGSLFLGVAG